MKVRTYVRNSTYMGVIALRYVDLKCMTIVLLSYVFCVSFLSYGSYNQYIRIWVYRSTEVEVFSYMKVNDAYRKN